MDFDSDDPLDDLLRDTSADKFKSSITTPKSTDVTPSSTSAPAVRKERKSALMSELFGTGSSMSGFILDDIRDQDKSANKPPSPLLSETFLRSDAGFEKPGSALSSSSAKLFGESSDDRKLDSLNLSSLRPESIDKRDSDFNLGGYVPSLGKSAAGFSALNSKSRPNSSGNSLTQIQNTYPLHPASQNTEHEKSNGISTSQPKTEAFGTSDIQPRKLFQEERANIFTPLAPNVELKTTVQPPAQVQSIQLDREMVSNIKESIASFSDNFCTKLETLAEKTTSIGEIACGMNELKNCLMSIVQHVTSAQYDRSQLSIDTEKRLLNMESKLEMLQHENANLRSRLEATENQLRDSRNELSRIKADTETAVENRLKEIKETINRLDNKLNSHSSQLQSEVVEKSQKVQNFEMLYGKLQDRLDDVERKQSERAAKAYSEEVKQLLQHELNWLRHEKDKLTKNRKSNKVELQEVRAQLNLLDQFTMELSRTVREHQFNLENADERLRKLERKWPSFVETKNDSVPENEKMKGKTSQVEDIGLALWKLHVKSDEQKLIEQQNFLQCVARSPI